MYLFMMLPTTKYVRTGYDDRDRKVNNFTVQFLAVELDEVAEILGYFC